eukprot:TRINITY_DN28205_c0_g1_i2.p1 TRINITY_DN28205_c0_g1~~TRINITY_DN28205_c0_g1_i2.p1  ORF type:complete len:468 (-),score=78.92 TRINITY_DN28205_c0_g1_i2:319-1722(-)
MKMKTTKRLRKGSLRGALQVLMKQKGGRKDINFEKAPKLATNAMHAVPIKKRAGYPLVRAKGSADPAKWTTNGGKKVVVDFVRHAWLPDDWCQGVKATNPTAHSTGGQGGTYTVIMSPDGKTFYHRSSAEEYAGRQFSAKDGFRGQLRQAWLQGEQAVFKNDTDASFFKILSSSERKCLPNKEDFHFCIISARRAGTVEGVKDIAVVQAAFLNAGISPTWYVDKSSLKDYQALGLKVVLGGKLTAARNKALRDARKKGKACVQVSDDVSAWEYRHGPQAKERTDEALNAAHEASSRFVISPVAAARFILAKMRAVDEPRKPQLGGVYMLSSCARTFAGPSVSRRHFILGDFFVDDKSKVLFDENMTLKEDYDFTCAHIRAYGSVLRCNRMTLHAKHYSNSGGACENRDTKGSEERKNIAILNQKWPHAFRPHHKRKNEVILSWKGSVEDAEGSESKRTNPAVKKRRL